MNTYVIPFERLGMHDVETVGGKNASLGEMIGSLAKLGVQVPGGFATTAHAYREFLKQGGLDARIRAELAGHTVWQISLPTLRVSTLRTTRLPMTMALAATMRMPM